MSDLIERLRSLGECPPLKYDGSIVAWTISAAALAQEAATALSQEPRPTAVECPNCHMFFGIEGNARAAPEAK